MTNIPSLLPVRVEHSGRVAIRDGVLLCLYIRKPHKVAAESVGHLYDRWIEVVGVDSVRWYRAKDEWKELTEHERARLRGLLGGGGRKDVRVAVKGGDRADEEMVHGFDYWGDEAPGPENAIASFVEVRFATEWVNERGLDAFAEIAADLAGRVAFSSGYASLAFHIAMDVPGWVDAHAFRHPGMDVHANEYTSRDIDGMVRGAYWLTFVGPEGLGRLGGVAALQKAVAGGISIEPCGAGVMIRAGEELRPGDLEHGDDLPLTRAVARVLEPITLQDTVVFGFTGDDEEEQFAAWTRRHLTESDA